MGGDAIWFVDVLAGVRGELESLCHGFGVASVCSAVLEGFAEALPSWFSGRKRRVIASVILYTSLLIARGVRKGLLKDVLEALGVSKPSFRDAFSRVAFVDWDTGLVYLEPRLFEALSKRVRLPGHVRRYSVGEVVRNRVEKVYPGLYSSLDLVCMKSCGKSYLKTLLEEPEMARDAVLKLSTPGVARWIVEKSVATIAELLDIDAEPSKVAQLLFEDPEAFKTAMRSLIEKASSG
ncbi:MAG: hypothetical protein QXG81_02985 [Ignisphaera sp.]